MIPRRRSTALRFKRASLSIILVHLRRRTQVGRRKSVVTPGPLSVQALVPNSCTPRSRDRFGWVDRGQHQAILERQLPGYLKLSIAKKIENNLFLKARD